MTPRDHAALDLLVTPERSDAADRIG